VDLLERELFDDLSGRIEITLFIKLSEGRVDEEEKL
jgi:hypothetical protein